MKRQHPVVSTALVYCKYASTIEIIVFSTEFCDFWHVRGRLGNRPSPFALRLLCCYQLASQTGNLSLPLRITILRISSSDFHIQRSSHGLSIAAVMLCCRHTIGLNPPFTKSYRTPSNYAGLAGLPHRSTHSSRARSPPAVHFQAV
jgi:hypothetical protein